MDFSIRLSRVATDSMGILGAFLFLGFFQPGLFGNGIDRNGVGAQSMGVAGASMANEDDPLTSASQNPAGLGFLQKPDITASLAGAWALGDYRNAYNGGGHLRDTWGLLPDFIWRQPIMQDMAMAFSVVTDSTRKADWYYRDPPGGGTGATTYGMRDFQSSIVNVRTAISLGWKFSDHWSVGASVGVTYNRNELSTPYTFQSQPAVAGYKTLLDLKTAGVGANGGMSVDWKPTDSFAMAWSYNSPTHFATRGRAKGDVTQQLVDAGIVGVPGQFRYDAKVATNLPQKIAWGASWKATSRLRLSGQVEWADWSSAYDKLDVRLAGGSNAAINSVVGSSAMQDQIALDWKDSFIYRAGLEYDIDDTWTVRMGYSYGKSPVPTQTLLPTTAAISEHTIAFGLGCKLKGCRIDFAYQYDLPAAQESSAAAIRGPEYKNSNVEVQAHWLGISTTIPF